MTAQGDNLDGMGQANQPHPGRIKPARLAATRQGCDMADGVKPVNEAGERVWVGEAPTHCDLCGVRLLATFVDGRTRMGPWAIMCPICRVDCGPGDLGPGRGQKYERRGVGSTARWVKTAG